MASSGSSSGSTVNEVGISSFVTIKLSGVTDYRPWKEQMMCFLEYHDKVGFIDGDTKRNTTKYWKKLDTLVKGWIFGTLNKDVMDNVLGIDNAYEVWNKLKDSYDISLRVEGADIYTEEQINSEEKEKVAYYIPLCRAIVRGDWDKAQEFFNRDKDTLIAKIDEEENSALHLAVFRFQNLRFVKNLLKEISSEKLPTLLNNSNSTILHRAAMVGNTEAAKMLVEKNPRLLFITDEDDHLPILRAIANCHEKTFLYLLEASKLPMKIMSDLSQDNSSQDNSMSDRSQDNTPSYQNPFEGKHGSWLFGTVIDHGYMDIAYELICEYPNLAISEDLTKTPLRLIVDNESLYFSPTQYNSYQRFIYSHVSIGENISENDNMIPDIENPKTCSTKFVTMCKRSCFYRVPHIKHLQEEKLKHKKSLMILERICEEIGKLNNMAMIFNQYCGAFNSAVLKDNREAVEIIIRFFPYAILTKNDDNFISQVVAKYRCEMVLNFLEDQAHGGYNLFLSVPSDKEDNNILHLAGRLAPLEKLEMVSGAALQMQREVRWFKKIEKLVLSSYKGEKNLKQQTPIMVFREEHKQLRKEGEEWMKKTSDSYTITAALIITIVFAAAITVPGGNDQNTGKPIYKTHTSFIVFAISDAISLFTSTTSLLLFLSILTARYHEDDFLYKLPKRLILGLVMLFVSVTSMMVAFGATLFIMFGQGRAWILIPIAVLACLPVASYVILQYPLLAELFSSTYGHGIYNKRNDRKNK